MAIAPVGIVLFEGPSAIDGAPIVVVATGLARPSNNEKTGPMVQTWILRADIEPHAARTGGEDVSICGTCPLSGGRGCYVNVLQAPLAVYRAYKRGVYAPYNPAEHDHLFEGRSIRFGAYGDPVAAPYRLWAHLARVADGWTGYTHQWGVGKHWRFRSLLMASTHSTEENATAHAKGWRTFRTKTSAQPAAAGEIVCPASPEGGNRRTCDTCRACNGSNGNPRRVSIVIDVHGSKPTVANAVKAIS